MAPASFDPVAVLLVRYEMRICERFGLAPDRTRALAWWQFEQAMQLVDEWLERGGR